MFLIQYGILSFKFQVRMGSCVGKRRLPPDDPGNPVFANEPPPSPEPELVRLRAQSTYSNRDNWSGHAKIEEEEEQKQNKKKNKKVGFSTPN
jgi:hypothetical protein